MSHIRALLYEIISNDNEFDHIIDNGRKYLVWTSIKVDLNLEELFGEDNTKNFDVFCKNCNCYLTKRTYVTHGRNNLTVAFPDNELPILTDCLKRREIDKKWEELRELVHQKKNYLAKTNARFGHDENTSQSQQDSNDSESEDESYKNLNSADSDDSSN